LAGVIVIPTDVEESLILSFFASSLFLLTVRDVSTSLDMTTELRSIQMQNRPSGFANPWFQLGFGVVCVLVYELLQKRGASETANLSQIWSWTGITALVSPLVWLAMALMIISLLSWLYVLRYIPLSIAFPLSRVVDVLIPLSCWLILGENISSRRWCGIALVVVGLLLTAKPVAQLEEKL
jgi:drug/metabolite transporter (DMT)-like permease